MTQTRRISLGFLLLALMALCSPATAGVVLFSDLGSTNPIYNASSGWVVSGSGGSSLTPYGEAFLFPVSGGGSFSVSQIDLAVDYAPPDVSSFNAAIWTNSGNSLMTLLGSWNLSANLFNPSCCDLLSVTGVTGITLTGGQSYFIALTPLSSTDASDITWSANNQGSALPQLRTTDGGATWVTYNPGTAPSGAFDVIGVATPEPGTLGTLGAGLLALGLLRKRLR